MNTTNKSTFKAENFNLHIFHKDMMHEGAYGLILGCTKDYANPPISREELQKLADFINNYLKDH